MKSLAQFVRSTLTGGVMFLLPVVLVIVIIKKATEVLSKVVSPFSKWLPDNDIFLGMDGHNLIAIALLIIVCFFGGLLFRSRHTQKSINKLEEHVLTYIPGYTLIKSVTSDALHADTEVFLKPVIVKGEDSMNLGFLVEETEAGLCTVFIPEAPRFDSGEVKIVNVSQIQKLNVPNNHVTRSLRSFGRGALSWLDQPDRPSS
jgi:uncharacterized membrane protein